MAKPPSLTWSHSSIQGDNPINITTESLEQLSSEILQLGKAMDRDVASIKKNIASLESQWKSPLGTEIETELNSLIPNLDLTMHQIRQYAAFLDNAIAAYESNEVRTVSSASGFGGSAFD